MSSLLPKSLHVDRTVLSVTSLSKPADDRTFWLSRTPQERVRHIEVLRRLNYGNRATERLQRVLESAQR
jgi:hypothetical protein